MKSTGVIYTAGGQQIYIDEAIYSARTVKKYNPNLGTTLFTTFKGVKSKYFDNIIYQEPIKHPQKYKVENLLKTPYENTLYIDSDTEIKGNIEEIFDFLLIYDMGVTNRVLCNWYPPPKPTEFLDYIDPYNFNGGFMLYRKSNKNDEFFKAWAKKMSVKDDIITGKPIGDQPLLNQLFFDERLHEKLGINFVILPNKIYNARPWLWKQSKADDQFGNIKILHARGLNKHILMKYYDNICHKVKSMTTSS